MHKLLLTFLTLSSISVSASEPKKKCTFQPGRIKDLQRASELAEKVNEIVKKYDLKNYTKIDKPTYSYKQEIVINDIDTLESILDEFECLQKKIKPKNKENGLIAYKGALVVDHSIECLLQLLESLPKK